jgi:xanthine/uracil permease
MKKYITFLLIGIYDLIIAIIDAQMEMPFLRVMSIVLAVIAGAMFMATFYEFVEGDDE